MRTLERIPAPDWARLPSCEVELVDVQSYRIIRSGRRHMLEVVHAEVVAYLGDDGLVFHGERDGFPHLSRLTGQYYLSDELYLGHCDSDWVQISIMCHFLQHAPAGLDRVDDYLGLEVWMRWESSTPRLFGIYRNTDSSAI